MIDVVNYITVEPIGVADLHVRSQEGLPVSGSVPDKYPDLFFHSLSQKCISKDLSGIVLIHYFVLMNTSVVNQTVCPFFKLFQ